MHTTRRFLPSIAMHCFFRLLLCLTLVFCSCTVQTYRYFADKAREGESIYIPDETEKHGGVLFYRVDGKTYVRGIRSRTMAKSTRYAEDYLPFSEIRIREEHFAIDDATQKSVYGEVKLQRFPNGRRYWEKTDSPWLDSLPDNARSFRSSDNLLGFESGKVVGVVDSEETRPMRATSKALYYYPLAAVTFTAVDVPLTLAGNAVLVCGGAVFLTAAGFESLFYGVCSVGEFCKDAFATEEEE